MRLVLDINVNSEVSFHNRATGYLKFRNNELAANPLNTSIVFSVRTDQKRALFFYAHDQFDNFIQVREFALHYIRVVPGSSGERIQDSSDP